MTHESGRRQTGTTPKAEAMHATERGGSDCSLGKILLVTKKLDESPNGGRELLCKLNYDTLREIYGTGLSLFELEPDTSSGISKYTNAVRGYIDGLNAETVADILEKLKTGKIDKLFIDGSNLGSLAKIVKKRVPGVEIYTFFHNVESAFFWGSFTQNWTLKSLVVLLVNFLVERKSVSYSDHIICLSSRDSAMLQKIFGRKADHLSAMAMEDKFEGVSTVPKRPVDGHYVLFVGGVFYANLAGIKWFVDNVASHLQVKVVVVGRGFEQHKEQLERNGNVQVVGTVDSMAQWYLNADFVIAPIFGGSGMKTKVAEALMFGKKIVGTPEAFSGYESVTNRVGCICEDAEQFLTAIEAVCAIDNTAFDPDLRDIYENNYSIDAARKRLLEIMAEPR